MHWIEKALAHKEELESIENTLSYIPRTDIGEIEKSYIIYGDGSKSFRITEYNQTISISKKDGRDPMKIVDFDGYWYGFDSSPYKMDHTSILIKLSNYKYMFVGWEIYIFETSDRIIDFVSTITNSNSLYPIAYGEHNVYFILEKRFIKKSSLHTSPTISNALDIYAELYGSLASRIAKHMKI